MPPALVLYPKKAVGVYNPSRPRHPAGLSYPAEFKLAAIGKVQHTQREPK